MGFIQVLTALSWVLTAFMIVYILYFIGVGVFTFRKLVVKKQIVEKNHRFAAVVAARNEEEVIGYLVRSLKAQNYPAELFDIYVIPNNCTDSTAAMAAEAGATILDCTVPVRSKGEVLTFFFDTMRAAGENYDAYFVFDADNVVHPDFVAEMNKTYCTGQRVAQGYRDSKNPSDTSISSCYSIYYWGVNCFFNQSRWNLGQSALVNGTGFMVAAEVIDKMDGWHTVTMTEDIEFSTQCAINGYQIAWVPKAIVYDEQPLTFMQSWKQRKRWTTGIFQCMKTYNKPLRRSVVHNKSFRAADLLVFFIAPFAQLAGVLSFALFAALNFMHIHYATSPVITIYTKFFFNLDYSYLSVFVFALFTAVVAKKNIFTSIKGILTFWIFAMSWIPISIVCIFKKTTNWEPIRHTRSLEFTQIVAGNDNKK